MSDITESHKSIANNLVHIHGGYRLANERSGVILYMACPTCLTTKGRSELESRHLAIMLDVWINSRSHRKVAKCMRCNSTFTAKQLLSFPNLEQRGLRVHVQNVIAEKKPAPIMYESSQSGINIPYPPGDTIPVSRLDNSHPVWEYLHSRNTLDIERLKTDFHMSYCIKEFPQNFDIGVIYKKLPASRNTPQGRIVFKSYNCGYLEAWQSRLVEKTAVVVKNEIEGSINISYHLHPDKHEFIATHIKNGDETFFIPPNTRKRDIPPKYFNGRFHKHNIVFGHDAYLENNKDIPYSDRVIYVTEGILDAVQFGGNGVAVLGKQISIEQIPILLKLSPKIIFATQNDDAAESGLDNNKEMMDRYNLSYDVIRPPLEFNDFGEMPYLKVKQLCQSQSLAKTHS